ncbi:hypothetical protein HIM_07510 [Hirsutella minnesotensis 3608]|uniref:tRNA (adenine(58)-N(1))-methyltransferase non-catalytic subunit TRM6 n=1 Tax=Hirsutella minnesotensis 3608 TaxID=1043627 RepID=A0A0F7ZHS5_9HYPO|nr:hypothetical protein HIM_07510 [Hirsutella minnesotensis 3608]
MPKNTIQPNGWVALRLPNENLRVLQVIPNATISLGKYGSFPSNLLIERPFHLTYEVQDKREGETFSRLRVVPASELNADQLADTSAIEELKRKGASAGKELIAKLMLSHTALDQKTAFSLAKYKLLKERKFLRRFAVLPLDVTLLAQWTLEDRDPGKIMDMRQEALGLVGCWADVHFGGLPMEGASGPHGGRWLAVDDTGGLLVAAMAERMGLLHREDDEGAALEYPTAEAKEQGTEAAPQLPADSSDTKPLAPCTSPKTQRSSRKRPRRDDLEDHYSLTNTITVIHANSQPNLSLLRYFDYDATDPNPSHPYHPLVTHLLPISWLQLVSPDQDPTYADKPVEASPEEMAAWKTNRRGNYHRKRRRWARTRQIINNTRAGGFYGLAVASTMDPVSVLRHALPLLAGGSPIAIYSPNVEPLTQLADCFNIARRTAWTASPPPEVEGKTAAELERWAGTPEFPINPTLVLGATIQTSRARRWQVLPGRTHPFMTARGGPEGYVFTGWRAIPAEGKISARGRYQKKRADGS